MKKKERNDERNNNGLFVILYLASKLRSYCFPTMLRILLSIIAATPTFLSVFLFHFSWVRFDVLVSWEDFVLCLCC